MIHRTAKSFGLRTVEQANLAASFKPTVENYFRNAALLCHWAGRVVQHCQNREWLPALFDFGMKRVCESFGFEDVGRGFEFVELARTLTL